MLRNDWLFGMLAPSGPYVELHSFGEARWPLVGRSGSLRCWNKSHRSCSCGVTARSSREPKVRDREEVFHTMIFFVNKISTVPLGP